MQSWFRFSCTDPYHTHGGLCSLGDNIACPRLQASCASGDIHEFLSCVSLMHSCSYWAPDMSEGPKAAKKPSFPYASQQLKKICSCPSTGFHYMGGASLIQNWKDTCPKVIFNNSVSGTFSLSKRSGVATEQLLQEIKKSVYFKRIKSGILGSVKQGFNFLVLHFTELSTCEGLRG